MVDLRAYDMPLMIIPQLIIAKALLV